MVSDAVVVEASVMEAVEGEVWRWQWRCMRYIIGIMASHLFKKVLNFVKRTDGPVNRTTD